MDHSLLTISRGAFIVSCDGICVQSLLAIKTAAALRLTCHLAIDQNREHMAAEHGKSKVLVIGSTGFIGKYIVRAGARLGHPTFALVRELSPSDGAKAALLQSFQDAGVTLLQGDLYDHDSLVQALKQVDVVVSTVGLGQLADQVKIIDAIKEAGNIKVGVEPLRDDLLRKLIV